METVQEDKVDQPHVRVEDRLQQDTSLDTLHRYLPSHFLDGDVVSDLGQEVDVGIDELVFVLLLVGEELLLRDGLILSVLAL